MRANKTSTSEVSVEAVELAEQVISVFGKKARPFIRALTKMQAKSGSAIGHRLVPLARTYLPAHLARVPVPISMLR